MKSFVFRIDSITSSVCELSPVGIRLITHHQLITHPRGRIIVINYKGLILGFAKGYKSPTPSIFGMEGGEQHGR